MVYRAIIDIIRENVNFRITIGIINKELYMYDITILYNVPLFFLLHIDLI